MRGGQNSQEAARQNAFGTLSQDRQPTAIFVSIDTLALGVLAAIDDLNLRVPDDVAVISLDDIQAAVYMKLTTVRQHLVYSGQSGAPRRRTGPHALTCTWRTRPRTMNSRRCQPLPCCQSCCGVSARSP